MQSRSTIVTAVLLLHAACGPDGAAPVLQPIEDRVVAVNQEVVVLLSGSDVDGDDLFYSFEAEVPSIQSRATVSRLPVGAGEFRWTPRADDVGVWFFDFTVSDGVNQDTVTARIEVRSAVGGNSAPRFLHPQGGGTTLDLGSRACLDLDIEVVDTDSTEVDIAVERPVIEGAELSPIGGLQARWTWCPTASQIGADDRYTLTLSAHDGDNPKTIHPYLIVLRKPVKPDCPGEAPAIVHAPADEETLVGLTIGAEVSDDQGLKRAPLLYWSTTPPAEPPDLSQMGQEQMLLIDGDMQSGTWAADLPNPVAGDPAGTSRTLYYLIVANDDDDPEGDCDHLSVAPETGTYSMTVTNPGGSGGAGLCTACTADVQCGDDAGDLCVLVGSGGDAFCLRSCQGSADCPSGYACSPDPLESVEGATGRQCVPTSESCTADPQCVDDAHEDDDTRQEAQTRPLLVPGTHDRMSCPASSGFGADEDWYQLFLDGDADVSFLLEGGSQSDLDLALYDSGGALLDASTSFTSIEDLSACLGQGTYYLRIRAYGSAENPYTLSYARTSTTCGPACMDDSNEPDDDAGQARFVFLGSGPYEALDERICSGDDDWYRVSLATGDTLVVDLLFDQVSSSGDLDIHLHDQDEVDLTPCSATDFQSCQLDNGQSGTSDEHFEFTTPAGCSSCTYYVVVRGYDGAENDYAISIDVE